jgi:hypothetical protein
MEEIEMAHLSLQIGAAQVVPFAARSRPARRGRNWRLRALREAAAAAGRDGSRSSSRKRRDRAFTPSDLTRRRTLAETAGE